jgi:hypothetical protein
MKAEKRGLLYGLENPMERGTVSTHPIFSNILDSEHLGLPEGFQKMCNRYQLSDCGERHECREKQPDDRVME